jgi:integrase
MFGVKARVAGTIRWLQIGRYGGPWTVETARKEALGIIGNIATGLHPTAPAKVAIKLTVAELCARYLAEADAGRILTRGRTKRKSTLDLDRGRIERHILPLLGSRCVEDLRRTDVQSFLHDVASGKTAGNFKTGFRGLARVTGGQTAANRATTLFAAVCTFAVKAELIQNNPARGLDLFEDGKRDRRLSDLEYVALGRGLQAASDANVWPPAVALAWFLVFSGWRVSEGAGLTVDAVNLEHQTAFLTETKTRGSIRPLPKLCCDLIRRAGRTEGLVFPAARGDKPMAFGKSHWRRIRGLAGLPADVTINVLRHSFQSLAADLNFSDAIIGAVAGHKGQSTASRNYVHFAPEIIVGAADKIAAEAKARINAPGSKPETQYSA